MRVKRLKESGWFAKATAVIGVWLLTSMPVVAHTLLRQPKAKISGTWQVNNALSSNGRSELPGQLTSEDNEVYVSLTDDWTLAEDDPRAIEYLEATELLEISQQGSEVTMNAIGGSDVVLTRTINVAGRACEQSFGFIAGRVVATLDGSILEIGTAGPSGFRAREYYQVTDDGNSLLLSLVVESPKWSHPLAIDRVYDRVK